MFKVQQVNKWSFILIIIATTSKGVSNRTGGVNAPGMLDVGVYGSNPNLVTNQNKIDIQSNINPLFTYI